MEEKITEVLHFATYFDINYINRGLSLYDSLKSNCTDFIFYVLCLDNETYTYLNNNQLYPNIISIQIHQIELTFSELIEIKKNRSVVEYYFTLSPFFPLYLLDRYDINHICTLDADIIFYSEPSKIFNYLDSYSIIITPHKFSNENKHLSKYGRFNVSFQIFKNDEFGRACLLNWKDECSEWCFDYFDEVNNRYADQKYLDNWVAIFGNKLKVLDDDSSGLAPWNINKFNLSIDNNILLSNNKTIVFYHFHHFKIYSNRISTNGFEEYKVNCNYIINKIYYEYWEDLKRNTIKPNFYDKNIRYYSSKDKLLKLITNEKSLYFKFLGKLYYVKLNGRLKFLTRLYAKINSIKIF